MSMISTYILYLSVFAFTAVMLYICRYTYRINYSCGKLNVSNCIRIVSLLFSVSLVILLSTFRFNTGTDYSSFENEYRWCTNNLNSIDSLKIAVEGYGDEPGLFILMKIGELLFGSFHGFLFLSSILTVIPVLIAYYIFDNKYIHYSFLLYLLSLFLSSFNGIHQHISVSLCLLAIVLAYKKRYIFSILIIIFAYFFHQTALFSFVFLILIYLSRKKTIAKFYLIVVISILSAISMKFILSVMRVVPFLAKYEYAFSENYEFSINFIIMHISFKLPLLMLALFCYKKLLKSDKRNLALLAYLFIDIVFVFSAFYMRWTMRMQYYTMAVAPLLISNMLSDYSENTGNKKILKYILLLTYLIRFFVLFGIYKYDSVIPYAFEIGS